MTQSKTDGNTASTQAEVVLRTRGLTKRFGKLVAVKGLGLELYRGEVFGFLGPNGAGKTTTVGMILGLVTPTSGAIEVFGLDLRHNLSPVLKQVGAVFESPAFYPYLSGRDNLVVISRAMGDIAPSTIDEVLERVHLAGRSGDKFGNYSTGMKQRLGIASTLLKNPKLILLDEPTSGLDPAGTKEVRDLIPQLAREGRTVFLCSHLLHEVEQVCNRVSIIKEGQTLFSGKVSDLLRGGERIKVRVDNPEAAASVLRGLDWIASVDREGDELLVGVAPDQASRVSKALAEHNIYPSEMTRKAMSLESVFLELTENESGD